MPSSLPKEQRSNEFSKKVLFFGISAIRNLTIGDSIAVFMSRETDIVFLQGFSLVLVSQPGFEEETPYFSFDASTTFE